jgi:NADPH:quinone reductase-like Zn-dependent oxidoreductase
MSQTIEHIGSHHAHEPKRGHMRAGVYRGKGQVVVESVPIPEIGEGELLFRVAACGICGTDIKKIRHGFVAAPQILGHELAGTVVKVQGWGSGGEFSPHSVRKLFLLRTETFFAVRGL